MAEFRVDGGFSAHPKVAAIPPRHRLPACGLWTVAGAWVVRHQPDNGFIPRGKVAEWGGLVLAAALEAVGLWERHEDGWKFHDWSEWNASVGVGRKRASERQRQYRRRARQGTSNDSGNCVTRDTNALEGEQGTLDLGKDFSVTRDTNAEVKVNGRPRTGKGSRGPRIVDTPEFAEFWRVYPRKKAKDRARKAWATVTATTPASVITDLARQFAEAERVAGTPIRYIPYASTWLNDARWDEPTEPRPQPRGSSVFINPAPEDAAAYYASWGEKETY